MQKEVEITINRPKLANYQEDILYNDARFTFTEASTKSGKTFCHVWWIFERAHEPWNNPGYNHWWVAPVYDQSKIAFSRLKHKIERTGLYKINETNLTIECPNGAMIRFRSADKADHLFGEDVYSIVFDEAPRSKVDAWYALRTTITSTGGIFKAIGNFGGVSNWMHQLKEKAKTDPKYAYYKITAWDAVREGILTKEEIDQAKADLPDKIFKQLYLAEAVEDIDQLISYETIDSIWTNDFVEPGIRYITADIAFSSDRFVLVVWSGWRIIHMKIYGKIESDALVEEMKSVARKYKVQKQNISYDADGLGAYLKGYLKGAKPFHNGGRPLKKENYKNLKSQCSYHFSKQVNEGMYIEPTVDIPRENIIRELECLRSYKLDGDGKMEIYPKKLIKEILGESPDILDALIQRPIFDLKSGSERKMF